MSNQLRIVLDTSIFHDFDRASNVLRRLRAQNVIKVYISPMLIDESCRLIFHNTASNDLRKRLEFILGISSERWLDDNFDIFKSELSLLPRRKDYQLLRPELEKALKDKLQKIIQGASFDADSEQRLRQGLESNERKAVNLRAQGIELRKLLSENLAHLGKKHKDITENWQGVRAKTLTQWGIDLIRRKDAYSMVFQMPATLIWLMKRSKCPFFCDWAQGMLYSGFYNMKYPNLGIDENAQADIQHLIFLREVDAIISNETGFMRKAWEDIYAPLGKKYLSISELEKLG